MKNFSVATWKTLDLFEGDPEAFLDFHDFINAEAICIKIGNGLRPWTGLEEHLIEAKLRGKKICGWWFYYGNEGEAEISAEHAEMLGVDILALDIEGQWEAKAGRTAKSRQQRAVQMMKVIRDRFSGETALCSWWMPSKHKTPIRHFLNEGCKWNMPQLYWIGRDTLEDVQSLIKWSFEEYENLAFWPADKTIPVLASYGQTYNNIAGEKFWWKATIEQMHAACDHVELLGCPSVNWWSLDYLQGGAGHEHPKVVEHEMIEKIRELGAPKPGCRPRRRKPRRR